MLDTLMGTGNPHQKFLSFHFYDPKVKNMRSIIVTMVVICSSSLGWWIGSQIGLITAFILSMVGTGLGIYFGRRFTQL